MPDIYGINNNGIKPRPTFEALINFEDYLVKYPDRSATFTRESPLLTQFDGIGMMELQEQEQREIAERQEYMIRQMAADTGQSAQILRAMNRRQFNAPPGALADFRINDVDALAQPFFEAHDAEQASMQQERIARMQGEVAGAFGSDDELAFKMAAFRITPQSSRESLPPPPPPSSTGYGANRQQPPSPPQGEASEARQLENEALQAMSDEDLNRQMSLRHLPYIESTTRAQNIIRILRYDFDRNQPAGVPRTMLNIPQQHHH